MSAARKLQSIPVDDYLAGELVSPIKHEYVGGVVHAMAGARNVHNRIAINAIVGVGSRLRGKRCQPCNSDTKIRIRLSDHTRFYYPDLSVVCRPNPQDDSFEDEPVVIFEVLSKRTRRIDVGEKKDAYLTIPSLAVYVLVEQEMPAVTVYRRGKQGFGPEVYEGMDTVLPLSEIGTELPLAEIYDGVEFTEEAEEED